MGWWIALGVVALIVLLLLLPLTVHLRFDGAELTATARYLGLRVYDFTSSGMFEKHHKHRIIGHTGGKSGKRTVILQESQMETLKRLLEEDETLSPVAFLVEFFRMILELLGKVLRGVVVRRYDLTVHVGSGDAMETAVDYGRACALLYPLTGMLETVLRVKQKCWDVRPDFLGDETVVDLKMRLTIPLVRVIYILVWLFVRYLLLLTDDGVEMNQPTGGNTNGK